MADLEVSLEKDFCEVESIKELDEETNDDETPEPFTKAGKCDDEVTLEFDNEKSLFVSRNFLRYTSPVFEAMFKDEFKEKGQNRVQLPGKNYDDFLTFLMCIHPAVLEPVDDSNVLCIATIAEEYQVASIKHACTEYMKIWLKGLVENARQGIHHLHHAEPLRHCLHIFTTANMLNYEDLITLAVKSIAKFGHILYNTWIPTPLSMRTSHVQLRKGFHFGGSVVPTTGTKVNDEAIGGIIKECMTLFGNLPLTIQCRILSERLMLWNDDGLKYL